VRKLVRSMRVRRVLCIVLSATTLACSGERDANTRAPDDWAGTELDSAGVRVVINPDAGTWTDETRWTLERDLAIGVLDGRPEYQFGHIVDVDVGTEGEIYVLDRQAAEIRVFDEGGSYLFLLGGPGEGPGELSTQPPGPRAVLASSSGDIFVPDQGNARVVRYGPAGEFRGSFSIRMEEGLAVAWFATPSGEYISHHSSPTWNGLVRLDPSGAVIDTVLEFDPRPPGIYAEGRRDALEHAALWTVLPDGRFVAGVSDRYRIEILFPNGVLEMLLKREPEVHRLSRNDQQRFLGRLAEVWAEMFRARRESEAWIESQVRQVEQVYVAPEFAPSFTGFAGGPEGTMWVRRALPVDSMTAAVLDGFRRPLREFWSPVWEVYSRHGRFLGEITMPPRFTPHKIRGMHVYGVERDALDVQRVVRLQIVVP
jgi:hypothetical protein